MVVNSPNSLLVTPRSLSLSLPFLIETTVLAGLPYRVVHGADPAEPAGHLHPPPGQQPPSHAAHEGRPGQVPAAPEAIGGGGR